MSFNRLYVSNLSTRASALSVERCFAPYGGVRNVELVAERYRGGSASAFVVMETTASAERAERALQGTELDGRSLMVTSAGVSADFPPARRTGPRGKAAEGTPKVAVTQQFRARIGMVYEVACAEEQLSFCIFSPPGDTAGTWHIELTAKKSKTTSASSGPTRQHAFDALALAWPTQDLDWPGIQLVLKNVRAI